MRNILVIVGNGMTIDLCKKINCSLNPSSPLSWNFEINQTPKISWQNAFPKFSSYANENIGRFENDFKLFENIREEQSDHHRIEARHFLALAYTYFEREIFTKKTWKWRKFMRANVDKIFQLISFNYDTIAETTILQESCKFGLTKGYSIGGFGEGNDLINLFKPHGCRTMETIFTISGLKIDYPMRLIMEQNNNPLKYLKEDEQLMPRKESYCILPYEKNIFQKYQWQDHIWNSMKENYKAIKHCVVIGHSYGEVDRPEIDTIINSLPLNTIIHICNPFPSKDFETFLIKSNRIFITHKDHAPNLS